MRRERQRRVDILVLLVSAIIGASLLATGVYKLVTLATSQLDKLEQRIEESHACGHEPHECAWEDN